MKVVQSACFQGVGGGSTYRQMHFAAWQLEFFFQQQGATKKDLTDHLAVAGLLVHAGDVGPVEELDELDHRFSLVLVGRDGAHEEREPVLRAQRRARREETHLKS